MVEYPIPCVGALIERSDGRILLLKSRKWAGKYIIPGGHLEVGEQPEDAVRREVREETGLDVKVEGLLSLASTVPENYSRNEALLSIDFHCRGEGEVKAEDTGEFEDVKWVFPREALEMDVDVCSLRVIKKFIELKKKP